MLRYASTLLEFWEKSALMKLVLTRKRLILHWKPFEKIILYILFETNYWKKKSFVHTFSFENLYILFWKKKFIEKKIICTYLLFWKFVHSFWKKIIEKSFVHTFLKKSLQQNVLYIPVNLYIYSFWKYHFCTSCVHN